MGRRDDSSHDGGNSYYFHGSLKWMMKLAVSCLKTRSAAPVIQIDHPFSVYLVIVVGLETRGRVRISSPFALAGTVGKVISLHRFRLWIASPAVAILIQLNPARPQEHAIPSSTLSPVSVSSRVLWMLLLRKPVHTRHTKNRTLLSQWHFLNSGMKSINPGKFPGATCCARRRNKPAPIKRPAKALVGSGTALQVSVFPDNVKAPATGVIVLKLLSTRETVDPNAAAQSEIATVPSVVKMSFQVWLAVQNPLAKVLSDTTTRKTAPPAEPPSTTPDVTILS